jgi:catechol 2,3-dioxygenase-like lactoylglutathione lyase family enzyme
VNVSAGRIRGLGEVSIRVADLDSMQRFYEDVVGLDVLRRDESFVFFRVAEGYDGHTQNLALFAATDLAFLETKSPRLSRDETTLHHIALTIALEDLETEKRRLEALGVEVRATEHEWLQVRSLYFSDPEGNLLELVCYAESVGAGPGPIEPAFTPEAGS